MAEGGDGKMPRKREQEEEVFCRALFHCVYSYTEAETYRAFVQKPPAVIHYVCLSTRESPLSVREK
jgi:hypothetical protein